MNTKNHESLPQRSAGILPALSLFLFTLFCVASFATNPPPDTLPSSATKFDNHDGTYTTIMAVVVITPTPTATNTPTPTATSTATPTPTPTP